MKVQLIHSGCSPALGVHYYQAFAESGWAGMITDEDYAPGGWYDLPDDMFQLNSGVVHWQCDNCGLVFSTRSRPGGQIKCPMCDTVATIPEDTVLEDDDVS